MSTHSGQNASPMRWEEVDGEWVGVTHDVEVPTTDGASYMAPSVCEVFVSDSRSEDDPPSYHIHAVVSVDADGRTGYREVTITCHRDVSPREMQRIPWSKIANAAVVSNAADTPDERASLNEGRWKQAAANSARLHRQKDEDSRRMYRKPVTDDRLREVLRLRAEAESKGLRYDEYVGRKLGYAPDYIRRLATKAGARGLIPSTE